jgi:hypothetical protein
MGDGRADRILRDGFHVGKARVAHRLSSAGAFDEPIQSWFRMDLCGASRLAE